MQKLLQLFSKTPSKQSLGTSKLRSFKIFMSRAAKIHNILLFNEFQEKGGGWVSSIPLFNFTLVDHRHPINQSITSVLFCLQITLTFYIYQNLSICPIQLTRHFSGPTFIFLSLCNALCSLWNQSGTMHTHFSTG